jgi:hypothetical protein
MLVIPKHRITPERVNTLSEGQIFVFGSNLAGRDGAGAAKHACDRFDAVYGVGQGPTGRCYAIPTKDWQIRTLSLNRIADCVKTFASYAMETDKVFLVTEIGCGLAGYGPQHIAPMFGWAIDQENIHLPLRFWEFLLKTNTITQ